MSTTTVPAAGEGVGRLNTAMPMGDSSDYDPTLTPIERARLLEEWANAHERGAQPFLSEEAIRRETLYTGTGGDR